VVHAEAAPAARARLRLGFVTQASASCEGEGLYTNAGLGRLLEALERRVETLTVGLSMAPARQLAHDHRLTLPLESVIGSQFVPSIARALFMGRECRRVVRAVERVSDVVLVQLPFAPPTALWPPRTARVYHVCADVIGVVKASKFRRGPVRAAAIAAAYAIDLGQRGLMHRRGARVVTNGDALYEHFGRPPGRAVVSSALRRDEVASVPRPRRAGARFRVLFVGFLRPEKGLDVLLDAFERVLERVPDAELHVVGDQDLSIDGAAQELRARIRRLEAGGHARLQGYLPFGRELFECYAHASVLALPSRSEGTPRVLLEARAFGCPVVATRVGGIPTSVSDGVDGLLVPSGDASALAAALLRVHDDAEVAERLSLAGLTRARRTTVEDYADAILTEATAVSGETRAED
jgi:glycosyltransferase involved in cell wall biosynthesis